MKKLNSNAKKVREAMRLHLVEISENDDVKVEIVEGAIQYISKKFIDEVLEYDKTGGNIQDLFVYWLNGLALNTYWATDDIIDYLHSIGLYGKDEKQEQEKAPELYHYLIFKEVKNCLYKMM